MNFLQETLEKIHNYGYSIEDIKFIGTDDYKSECTLDEFKVLADQDYYPESYSGLKEVLKELIIIFKDGRYMFRGEYDGTEWWEISLKKMSINNPKKLRDVFIDQKL